jgi:hypothetical protein
VWLTDGQLNVGGYDHTKEDISRAEELLPAGTPLEQARWIAGKDIFIPDLEKHLNFQANMRLSSDTLFRWASGKYSVVPGLDIVVPDMAKHFRGAGNPDDGGNVPALPRERAAGRGNSGHNLERKMLRDGRVIVAGGLAREYRIALLRDDSMQSDAEDEYVEIGDMAPANTYDIFEPATGTWRQSAPSRGVGGVVAVLDDGRVASYGKIAKAGQNDDGGESEPLETIMEISSADGKSWNAVAKPEAVPERANLFVHQGELFVAGDFPRSNTGVLQWFDNAAQRWEILWQADPQKNWRKYAGLIVVRELGNGKRVMLPVVGLK